MNSHNGKKFKLKFGFVSLRSMPKELLTATFISVLDYGNIVYMHASLAVLTCAVCCVPWSTEVYHMPLLTIACMLRLDGLPCSFVDVTSGFFVFVRFLFFVHFHLTSNSISFKKKKVQGNYCLGFLPSFPEAHTGLQKRVLLPLLGMSRKIT